LPPELPGVAAGNALLDAMGTDLADKLSGADSLLDGTSNRKIGGQVTTEVFGVQGTGSRFVYVFDRSASMEGYEGRPLRAAKRALLESLKSLSDNHQFQIIFYNDQTRDFNSESGSTRLHFATADNQRRAEKFVQSIVGQSGTNHMIALKKALALGPDVVFLLTDAEGGFTANELSLIGDWNRSGAVINAIEFGVGSSQGDHSLARLAAENRGHYSYKNVLTLQE
jgi:hypothetical protein